MLAVRWIVVCEMNRIIKHLCLFVALIVTALAGLARAADETPESAQAKAKLAEVRSQIAALTGRLGGELKQRDVLNSRLRDIELGLTAKRQRLESLRSAEIAALRRRGELRLEVSGVKSDLDSERTQLASQVRAAYMMGEQERIKLLLNQNDPSSAGCGWSGSRGWKRNWTKPPKNCEHCRAMPPGRWPICSTPAKIARWPWRR